MVFHFAEVSSVSQGTDDDVNRVLGRSLFTTDKISSFTG
jgi:hypothetical protein